MLNDVGHAPFPQRAFSAFQQAGREQNVGPCLRGTSKLKSYPRRNRFRKEKKRMLYSSRRIRQEVQNTTKCPGLTIHTERSCKCLTALLLFSFIHHKKSVKVYGDVARYSG